VSGRHRRSRRWRPRAEPGRRGVPRIPCSADRPYVRSRPG
jgi:hypothetical protein